jgi:hypothetical protein
MVWLFNGCDIRFRPDAAEVNAWRIVTLPRVIEVVRQRLDRPATLNIICAGGEVYDLEVLDPAGYNYVVTRQAPDLAITYGPSIVVPAAPVVALGPRAYFED